MTPILLPLLLTALALGILVDEADLQKEITKIESRIDNLIYRAIKIEHELESRTEPVKLQRDMRYRIHQVEGTGCRKDFFQCSGIDSNNDPQCVNILFVCDGHKDCRNGADEDNCETHLKSDDVFVGTVVYDNCHAWSSKFRTSDFVVKSVGPKTPFASTTNLVINIKIIREDEGFQDEYILVSNCFYEPSTRRLICDPTGYVTVGFACTFEESNTDQCIGTTLIDTAVRSCAHYVFTRKHD